MTNPDASPFPSDYSDSDDSDGERKIADDPTPKHAPMLAGSAAALAMSAEMKAQAIAANSGGLTMEEQRQQWNANKDVVLMQQQQEREREEAARKARMDEMAKQEQADEAAHQQREAEKVTIFLNVYVKSE